MVAVARVAAPHAVPVSSTPAAEAVLGEAPAEVAIRFSERVESRASTLEVLDAHGRRVDDGRARVDPGDPWTYRVGLSRAPAGTYTVAWRVLSADDGHVTEGSHAFAVGTGSVPRGTARVTAHGPGLRPAARWLVVAGGALLLGAPAAGVWLRRADVRLSRDHGPRVEQGTAGRLRALPALGAGAVLAGATLDLLLQLHQLAGSRPARLALAALVDTPPGRLWLCRVILVALLAALWALPRRGPGLWRPVAQTALAAVVVASGATVSHAAGIVEGRALALAAQALHLLAAAAWVGGLLGFLAILRIGAAPPASDEARGLATAIPRFSRLAILAVAALAASGLLLARLHLGAWNELGGTTYGRWLLAKLGAFAGMLALGAHHQGRVHVRLRDALARSGGEADLIPRFRRTLRAEAALGLLALALAAVLGVTPPPVGRGDTAAGAGFRHERTLDEAHVRLDVRPSRPGPNTIELTVTDRSSRPLAGARAALVQLVPEAGGVGPATFTLDPVAPGVFRATGATLGLVGRWEGRLVVQRESAYDVNDRFELVVADPSATANRPGRATPLDPVTTGSLAAIATAAAVLWARARRAERAARGPAGGGDGLHHPHAPGGHA